MIDFPAAPSPGDQFSSGGLTWVWDGVKWTSAGGAGGGGGNFLPLTGGTLSGPLTLNGTLQANAPAIIMPATGNVVIQPQAGFVTISPATKGLIANMELGAANPQPATITALNGGQLAGHRNRIINGEMLVAQRPNRVTAIGGGPEVYVRDRFGVVIGAAGGAIMVAVGGNPPGLGSSLSCNTTTPHSCAADEAACIFHRIEGVNIADFGWPRAGGQPATLSFWAYSYATGTYGGALGDGSASFTFTFTITALYTWQYFSVPIPAPSIGSFPADNTVGLQIAWDLGSGSNYLAPPGSWVSGNLLGAPGANSVIGGLDNLLNLSGVQLEVGTQATPFERRSYGAELALCQRYYQRYVSSAAGGVFQLYSNAYDGGLPVSMGSIFPTMRDTPSIAEIGTWVLANAESLNLTCQDPSSLFFYCTSIAGGTVQAYPPADGGFELDAEL